MVSVGWWNDRPEFNANSVENANPDFRGLVCDSFPEKKFQERFPVKYTGKRFLWIYLVSVTLCLWRGLGLRKNLEVGCLRN